MLLEFRVKNFRSIRDEQALNLSATTDKAFAATHTALTGLKSPQSVVKSAVIYGPNASGKSTLLMALNYMKSVIAESATVIQPGQTFNVQPFRLDEAFLREPTEFEITFLLGGIRHQYSFSMTTERIVSETLLFYKTSKPSKLFSRELSQDGESYVYEYSTHLTGARKVWQDSTRQNALFLSTAAQLNSELLSPIFRWIVENIVVLPARMMFDPSLTTAMLESEEGRKSIQEFLVAADISIAEVVPITRKGVTSQLVFHPGGTTSSTQEESEITIPLFLHKAAKGSAKFELQEESDGTQRLYWLIAPVLDVLRSGKVLAVDELDGSLHSLLVRRLISLFQNSETNPSNAQLVFTTHDTSLLDHSLFRRDQIWFTEKDGDQATTLYPLTDFGARKKEAWEHGYLSGRYGAVPFFSRFPDLLHAKAKIEID